MGVTWIKKSEETGSAVFTNNYIVINKAFADKFMKSYKALLGLDDSGNIVLKPLSLDESESTKYEDSVLLKVSVSSSYVRLGNVASMKVIGELIKQDISSNGKKFETYWDNKESALVVSTGGKN